ncbi:fumarylacetoacetate hydrolase family protein [Oceanicella sp. SM1341]|uniref:fumarylacetoacetate hydrolase family protein n=1 Tax=Oceanicella sp. SM1341 TaxID=1548889 RepID=UPI000E543380|nr:fumarylacetoacetate hydrolase family protein [Oceanicella sp. SM1341]
MRLLSFGLNGVLHAGAWVPEGIIDLSVRMEGASVREILESGRLAEAEALAARVPADHAHDAVEHALPIPDPEKIYCVGVNYMNRNEEYKDGSDAPKYPSLFVRNPLSFSPHGQAVLVPPESEQLDYEGEIVLVIGTAGRRIPQSAAMDHVAGFTVMNEGTIRDWVRHGKFNVTPGKNWDRSGGLGPWIETAPEGVDIHDMRVETRVNGELRQSDTTASMAFPFERIIEYVSSFATLLPGDLIATGTPTGAGARFDPPKWLVEGDVVEVTVEGVGSLRNPVEKERPRGA